MLSDSSAPVALAISLALLIVSCAVAIGLLRDWMDPWRGYHVLAVALTALGALPCLLLPLERQRFGAAANPQVYAYEAVHLVMWSMIFVVMPGALIAAAADAEPTRWRRNRGSTLICSCCVLGALLGVVLSVGSPLLVPYAPVTSLRATEPWLRALLKANIARIPRAQLDLPIALWLISGMLTLAIHGAAGAVALPAMLMPPPRVGSRAEQVSKLRAALEATREERRALSSQYDLRGRPMRKAQREKQRALEARELRLSAQAQHLGASSGGCADYCSGTRRLRSAAAIVALLLAAFFGISLGVSLASQASRSHCGALCGYQSAPYDANNGVVDIAAAAETAVAAAAAAAARATDAAESYSDSAVEASSTALRLALSAASAAALAAASTPVDTMLLAAARAPPLDAVIVLLMLMLIFAWVVAAAAAGGPCAVLRQHREAHRDSTHGAPTRGWTKVLCCFDNCCNGCCCNCCCDFCCGVCAVGLSPAWSIRYRGSSAAALLRLSIRLMLAALAFAALLLTLAPQWSRAVSTGTSTMHFSLPPPPPPLHGTHDGWYAVQPPLRRPRDAGSLSPSRRLAAVMDTSADAHSELSVAAATLLSLTARVPLFGVVWFFSQWLLVGMLLLHLGWAAWRAVSRLMLAARAPAEGLSANTAEDEERTPLRTPKRKGQSSREAHDTEFDEVESC